VYYGVIKVVFFCRNR